MAGGGRGACSRNVITKRYAHNVMKALGIVKVKSS
jgi:hypothetical protein